MQTKTLSLTIGMLLLLAVSMAQVPSKKISSNKRISQKSFHSINSFSGYLENKARSSEEYSFLVEKADKVSLLLFGCLNDLENEGKYYGRDKSVVRKYYEEIENYNDLLKYMENIDNTDSIDSILSFMEEDLSLKYSTESAPGAERKASFVTVKVRVLNESGDREEPGYMVFVKPEFSVNPRHVESFNPTSNAIKEILPGKKLVWIEKDGRRIDQRKTGIRISPQTVFVDFIIPR